MGKKPNISKEAQVLLKLLRIALGTEPRKYFGEVVEPFPEGIDWKEVVRLSYEHKVSAIAVDGLEASKYDPYKGLDEKQTEELKAVLVPWIKDVENTEWSYCYYVEVLKTLCQIFKDNGLTPIILKGYGLSLNYPRPSHRGAGDIDIFLIDKDGKPAAEEGDVLAENVLSLIVKGRDNPHHSAFTFKGIRVENHYQLHGQCRNNTNKEEFRCFLQDATITKRVEIEGISYPSDSVCVILQVQHLFHHFSGIDAIMRQLVDLTVFLIAKQKEIDWDYINYSLEYFHLKDFFDGIVGMLVVWLKLPRQFLPPKYTYNESLTNHLIHDFLLRKNSPQPSWRNMLVSFRRGWNLRYFKNKSLVSFLLQQITPRILL